MIRKTKLSIDAYHLKLFAIITMVIDHSYKLFTPEIITTLSTFLPMNMIFFVIYIGFGFTRMTFPIFAFFIAEGCYYTKNRQKYLFRLFLFGLLSEIPFQYFICELMGNSFVLSLGLTNVFFTLFLGALAITIYDECKRREIGTYLSFLPLLICIVISFLLNTDYGGFGVFMIFVCYYFHDRKCKLQALGFVITIFALGYVPITDIIANGFVLPYVVIYLTDWMFMMMSVSLLNKYQGTRGKAMKYFFYLFYPVHILCLLILRNFFLI